MFKRLVKPMISSFLHCSRVEHTCSLPLYPSFWLFFNYMFGTFAAFREVITKSNTLFLFLIIMTVIIFGFRAR